MAKLPVSPLAPAAFPDLPVIAGASFAAGAAGVKYAGRTDVMLARLAPGSTLAGAFTRSSTRAACVLDCQAKLAAAGIAPQGAAIVVNSGNANAFTGRAGTASVAAVCAAAAEATGVPAGRVLTSSTGVIGEPLPHERIAAILPALAAQLSEGALPEAARAIMTTDTFPKGAAAEIAGEGGPIRIAGIAKGSGMIAPDMATMLVYIFTDAAIPPEILQRMLTRGLHGSFNAITVDSDTSTSDAVLLADAGAEAEAARMTGGDGFDVVVDATGAAVPIERGFGFLAHGARYVLLSVVRENISFSDPEFHTREATLLASRNALAEDFAEVVRQMQAGRIPTRALNTHRGRLADAATLIPDWARPEAGVIKAILDV